jgi:3-hydroxybutyryl-CoA dehydratase
MTFTPDQSFSKPYLFDAAGIVAFASLAGDMNRLHHDAVVVEHPRFEEMIASGAHMTAVLMGFGATIISREHDSLGLEFTFRFERAIFADTPTVLSWTVTTAEPHAKLGGTLLTMRGAITSGDGVRHVSAHGTAVVWPKGTSRG